MDKVNISCKYDVRKLTENDVDEIYELSIENPLFYKYCPPFVTKESILEDMKALPSKMTYKDKYYIGFWEGETLIAVMDFITNYPNDNTVFIGLFMVNHLVQGVGVGSSIIEDCSLYFKSQGYSFVKLGYAKGNLQSENFWRKNGFIDTGVTYQNEGYVVVVLQKTL